MRSLVSAILGLLALSVAGQCAARAAEPLVMTYIKSNADFWDIDVAIQKGFLKQEGFDPQFATNSGSVQSAQMLLTGAVQLAVMQPEALISAYTHGASDIGALFSPMRRVDWILVGRKGVKSLADLKGQTLGFSGLRVSEYWLTQKVLKEAGLPPDSYSGIQVGITPAKYAALIKGSIAAAVLFQPTASEAVRAGFPELADLGDQAGYLPGLYVVNRKWAAAKDNGVRLSRALTRAHQWLYDPKNRAEAVAMMQAASKMPKTVVSDVYDIFFVTKKRYTKKGEIDLSALKTAESTLIDHHVLAAKAAPRLADLLIKQPGSAGAGGR